MTFDRISDEAIVVLVRAFYDKVRRDPQLEPVFAAMIGGRWDAHISRMCRFWRFAMRLSRRYEGDMLATHRRVRAIRPALFKIWLGLFEETVNEHFAGDAGAALCDRARKSARNLELALFGRDGASREAGDPCRGASADATRPARSISGGLDDREEAAPSP